MKAARTIFQFLIAAQERGERTALVTITDVIGSASRMAGTHMAVSETGDFSGSLSGGCVEAAVVGEALRIIETGLPEQIRFGAGSPFIDIRLPCGGGLDLSVIPNPDHDVLKALDRDLEARRPTMIEIGRDGRIAHVPASRRHDGMDGQSFFTVHHPDLRLFIIGHGAETEALARLAITYGADAVVLSPDMGIVERARLNAAQGFVLNTPAPSPHLVCDRYSAVIMLFHDHDWESRLLAQALEQDPFFIGAMGSRNSHARRIDTLRAQGISEPLLDRITGPIGLIPASRDPETLALSVLAQVVAEFERVLERAIIPVPSLYLTRYNETAIHEQTK